MSSYDEKIVTGEILEQIYKHIINKINNITDSNPIGTILSFISDNVPNGYLLCDGREIIQSEYPELYNLLPKNIDNPTRKYLPDLRGKFIRGNNSGRDLLSLQNQDFKTLQIMNTLNNPSQPERDSFKSVPKNGESELIGTGASIGDWESVKYKWDNSEIRPINISVNFIIKAKQI